jgi:hypothetical protein
MKLYEKTNYPEIYINSYWGQCAYQPEDNCARDDILAARNKFVDTHKIRLPCHHNASKLSDVLGKKWSVQ